MKTLLAGLLLAAGLQAASWHSVWHFTAGAFAAANVADGVSSSRSGLVETNPILGRGTFGARQWGIKMGGVAALLVVQHFTLRRHPQLAKTWSVVNLAGTAGITACTVHNIRLKE